MNLIKNPKINAAIIPVITLFYSLVFILTSGNLEFERILGHANTLNSTLWNFWSEFLKKGYLKYIGEEIRTGLPDWPGVFARL